MTAVDVIFHEQWLHMNVKDGICAYRSHELQSLSLKTIFRMSFFFSGALGGGGGGGCESHENEVGQKNAMFQRGRYSPRFLFPRFIHINKKKSRDFI